MSFVGSATDASMPRLLPAFRKRYPDVELADTLAPAVNCVEAGEDREVPTLAAPIVALLLKADDLLVVVHERGAALLLQDGRTLATPWPAGSTLAACSGQVGIVWTAMRTGEGESSIGQARDDGPFVPGWRVIEPVAALCWHAADGLPCASAPGAGAILLPRPGDPALRRLATVPKGSGRVGGLAVDHQGGIWAALADGRSVVRFTPDGQLDRVIGLPVSCATDLTLSTTEPRQLFITASRQSVPLDGLGNATLSGRLLGTLV